MSSKQTDRLLREATEAARENDRGRAKILVKQVLESDPTNLKGWTLLYRIAETTSEKRIALESILEIDPANVKAQEALDRLDQREKLQEEEVAPGISRSQVRLIGGALLAVVVVFIVIVMGIVTLNRSANSNEISTRTAVAQQATQLTVLETQSAGTATQAHLDATATFFAINSPTPTASETRLSPPTLPPEFTHTPTATPPITPTQLPLPPGASGTILGYGGSNILNDGYYPVVAIPVNAVGVPRPITEGNETRGRNVTARSFDHIVYTQYSRQTFEFALAELLDGSPVPTYMAARWQGTSQPVVLFADQAHFSADGSKLVFVALNAANHTGIFILDYNDADGDPLTMVIGDNFDYGFPAFSPDGNFVVASRSDGNEVLPNIDLFRINLSTGGLQPITTDGSATFESMPRFSPDGREVVYAATSVLEGNRDLFIRAADGSGEALNITNTPDSDELHPTYSPDGRFIAFASNRVGGYNVYAYDRTDGSLYQVTVGRDNYFPGTWVEQ